MKRTYFSAFSPVEETEFKNKEACDVARTNKLYNADSLLNSYNYNVKELYFDDDDQLDLSTDPKILAARNMDIFPVEINSSSFRELVRVPGIGTKSARKIISIRKKQPFASKEDLRKLGVAVERAEPYIKMKGEFQSNLNNF